MSYSISKNLIIELGLKGKKWKLSSYYFPFFPLLGLTHLPEEFVLILKFFTRPSFQLSNFFIIFQFLSKVPGGFLCRDHHAHRNRLNDHRRVVGQLPPRLDITAKMSVGDLPDDQSGCYPYGRIKEYFTCYNNNA